MPGGVKDKLQPSLAATFSDAIPGDRCSKFEHYISFLIKQQSRRKKKSGIFSGGDPGGNEKACRLFSEPVFACGSRIPGSVIPSEKLRQSQGNRQGQVNYAGSDGGLLKTGIQSNAAVLF